MMNPRPALWSVAALLGAIFLVPVIEPIERRGFDLRLASRPDAGWPDDLVMIPITDAAMRQHGRWPWSRARVAGLFDQLRAAGVRTILFDAIMTAPTEPEADRLMANSLSRVVTGVGYSENSGEAVVGTSLRAAMLDVRPFPRVELGSNNLAVPPVEFARQAGLGHVMLDVKNDGSVRGHIPLLGVYGETGSLPSLSLLAWLRQRGHDAEKLRTDDDTLFLPDGRTIAIYGGEMYLDLVPGGRQPPSIPVEEILATADAASLRPRLGGKLVILHVDSISSPDALPSPLGPKTPGGLLQAYAIRTFEYGSVPIPVNRWATLLVCFLAAAAAAPWLARRQPARVLTVAGVAALAAVAASWWLVRVADVFIPVALPASFFLLWGGVMAAHASRLVEGERRALRNLLRAETIAHASVPDGSATPLGDRATAAATPRSASPNSADTESLQGGRALDQPVQIGRYLVQRSIGRGGMGAIFLAVDQDLARPVALKILSAANEDAFKRFRREALAVARVVHPNVVQIYEVGFDATVPYIVMEYLAGGTVSDLLRNPDGGKLIPWQKSARIIAGVARGLGAAHVNGIVHRDVKPANLLLTRPGGDMAKVADFGIAKLAGSENLTAEGNFLGTIGYLAPEQAMGKEVDARSDVYSLGITLYRMLTGRFAYEGTTAQILRAAIAEPVPDPRTINAEIPPGLAELVRSMTAIDPNERPAGGDQVAVALESILAHGG